MIHLVQNDPTLYFSVLPIDLKVITAQCFYGSNLPSNHRIDLFAPDTILQTYSEWQRHPYYTHYLNDDCAAIKYQTSRTVLNYENLKNTTKKVASLQDSNFSKELIKLIYEPENLVKYLEAHQRLIVCRVYFFIIILIGLAYNRSGPRLSA